MSFSVWQSAESARRATSGKAIIMYMYNFRYKLERYDGPHTRFNCPECHELKTFTRYIDTLTMEYLDSEVGKCDRESSCGYHISPKEFFLRIGIPYKPNIATNIPKPEHTVIKPISLIPNKFFKNSMKAYALNNFVIFLKTLFGKEETRALTEKYLIGTSKYWPGGTVFWQMDKDKQVRTGKVMLYDPENGRRVKQPGNNRI